MTNDTTFLMDRCQVLLATAGTATLVCPTSVTAKDPGTTLKLGRFQPFDEGWRFYRGEGDKFEVPDLDDTAWRFVDVLNDWSIEEDLAPEPGEIKRRIIGPFAQSIEQILSRTSAVSKNTKRSRQLAR